MLELTHNLDQIDAALQATVAKLDATGPFLLRWGNRTARQARRNARAKGGRSFWYQIADSVNVAAVSANTVSVHTRHVAAAQKEFGGEIKPKPGTKALTIPISDEAKGRRAAEFEAGGRDLFVLSVKGDPDTVGILGYSEPDGDFHALFVLRTRSNPPADPWWPRQAQVLQFGLDEAKRLAQEAIQ